MVFIICLAVGFAAAFFGSLVGLGGGTILVPILLLLHVYLDDFAWVIPQTVVGISLVVMVFTGISSSISYFKSKRIDVTSGFVFLIGCIPGGILGSWLNQFIDTKTFSIYFGSVMVCMFFTFFIKRSPKQIENNHNSKWSLNRSISIDQTAYTYSVPWGGAIILSFIVGILSGLFGIGGGSLMVPAMILLFGFPPHIATATSMFMIIFLSSFSAVTHITLGNVPWQYVWLFIPGAWIGGTIGAKVNQRLNANTVQWVLRILLVIIGVRLIWQGIG
ncbi:sulfite exporter TauE/SafE family protein [Radiobacillus sp. PE A8.2]|uniref:sulfite exporter TauE/SafE family protein n=1 Tax=Radiobacillus sp. PE A8.2 TaxID=3380349 RepID=UPI00388D2419